MSYDAQRINEMKLYLHKKFQTKDLGHLRYFFSIEVARSNKEILLSQRRYVLDMLSKASMFESKLVESQMDANYKLLPDQEELLDNQGRNT